MANFVYTAADLDLPFTDVLGRGHSLALTDFGVSHEDYDAVAAVDFDAIEEFDAVVTQDVLERHGFVDMGEFMDAYTRSHIWNNYHLGGAPSNDKTLRGFLMHYYNKAKKFHPNENVPFPPNSGNMQEYMMSFKPEWLISVGW